MKKVINTALAAAFGIVRVFLFMLMAGNVCNVVEYYIKKHNQTLITTTLLPCVGVAIVLVCFFSVIRYAVLFDNDMRDAYMKEHEKIVTFSDKIRFFVRYRRVIASFIACILIYFAFTLNSWFPADHVLFGNAPIGFIKKLMVFPFALVVFSLIAVRAAVSALNFWSEDVFLAKHRRFKYTYFNYAKKTAVMIAAYIFGSIVFMMGVKVCLESLILNVAYFNRRSLITISSLLVCFVLIPFVYRNISAFLKRRKFLKKLKAICDEHRCSLSEIKHPYKSLVKKYDEYNFDFERNGKAYSCKLIYSKHRLRPMTFYEDGIGANTRIIKVKKTELFRINSYFKYGYESDSKKLIVINPIPKMLYASENGRSAMIDNGDRVGEYKIYSGTALINAIDRNTLDR